VIEVVVTVVVVVVEPVGQSVSKKNIGEQNTGGDNR